MNQQTRLMFLSNELITAGTKQLLAAFRLSGGL
jgi:hypothetical protein